MGAGRDATSLCKRRKKRYREIENYYFNFEYEHKEAAKEILLTSVARSGV